MKQGTKSILFGCHQFIWHPLFVIIGWTLYHNRFPKFWELICIIVHDWGIWGINYLDDPKNKLDHPRFGANIAEKYLGKKAWQLIGGHSLEFINSFNKFLASTSPLACEDKTLPWLKISDLFYADKYSWLLIPNFILSWQYYIEKFRLSENNKIVRDMAITCLHNKKDMHKEFIDRKIKHG